MWIDQICINQTDIEERDSQVLLMRDIYEHAARVQIWLGEATSDPPSSLAFDLLHGFLREDRADLLEYIMQIGIAQPGTTTLASTTLVGFSEMEKDARSHVVESLLVVPRSM